MSLRQIDDAHETVNAAGLAPTTTQALIASSSEPAVLLGSGSRHESDNSNTLAFGGTEDKSDTAQSYEPPTQQFDKLKNV